jgi:hypothetical protein
MREQEIAKIFFASVTYAFMVRSEGGRICCDFNGLSGFFKA